LLAGLSPLYKDFDADFWWFQIPQFVLTLIFCALVTMLPADGASQVFFALFLSVVMLVVAANYNPYLQASDDLLYQVCQVFLALAMAIGLLEKASESFSYRIFGPILIGGSCLVLGVGVSFSRTLINLDCMCSFI
jgi:hypothetical protein